MAEKKTAEIKLRIEPSVKAQWQQSAADEGIGLSEWIGKACERYRFALFAPRAPRTSSEQLESIDESISNARELVNSQWERTPPTEPVPTSESPEKFGSDWKPWG